MFELHVIDTEYDETEIQPKYLNTKSPCIIIDAVPDCDTSFKTQDEKQNENDIKLDVEGMETETHQNEKNNLEFLWRSVRSDVSSGYGTDREDICGNQT